jgi:hypothetical protein
MMWMLNKGLQTSKNSLSVVETIDPGLTAIIIWGFILPNYNSALFHLLGLDQIMSKDLQVNLFASSGLFSREILLSWFSRL